MKTGVTVAEVETLAVNTKGTLSAGRLLLYGGLAAPIAIAEVPILLYLPAFYAKEVGLSAAFVGIAFLLARLWDGCADLLVGWLSDRTHTPWGRRKPWVMMAAPALMATTWLLCNPPAHAGAAYLVFAAMAFYTADAAIKIPYMSWGAELATGFAERSRVSGYRESCAMVGNLFFVAAPLIFLPKGAPLHEVLLIITVMVLIMVPITATLLGTFVGDPVRQAQATPSLRGLLSLFRNPVMLRFGAFVLLANVGNGIINSLAVFAFSVGLGLPDELLWVILILYVATLTAVPILVRLSANLEKHWMAATGLVIMALCNLAHLFIPSGQFGWVATLWFLSGIGNAAYLIIPTSMLADMIDHGEYHSGQQRGGAYMAVFNLLKKIGMALGVGVAFGMLGLIAFDPSAPTHSDVDAQNIRLLAFGLSAAIMILSAIILWRYPITRAVHRQLRDAIDHGRMGTAQ